MKISRNNYELIFLDYHEGRLDYDETKDLFRFLEMNPDLREEFESFENIIMPAEIEKNSFPGKGMLRKKEIKAFGNVIEENFREKFIAYFEGDLSDEEKQDVQNFISLNPDLENEFQTFGMLKISPDEGIVYPDKLKLMQKVFISSGRLFLKYAASVAAIFIMGLTLYYFIENERKQLFNNVVNSANRSEISGFLSEKNNLPELNNQLQLQKKHSISEDHFRAPENIIPEQIPSGRTGSITGYAFLPQPDEKPRLEFAEIYKLQNERMKLYGKDELSHPADNATRLFDNVKSSVRNNAETAEEHLSRINGWRIKGFNFLTDNNFDFRVKSNDEGQVTKISFDNFALPLKTNR